MESKEIKKIIKRLETAKKNYLASDKENEK